MDSHALSDWYGGSASDSAPSASSAPPKPPPKISGRKGSRKVRTGCITCKIRKVKCDETKPSCLRCVKTGRRCDGYMMPTPRPSVSAANSRLMNTTRPPRTLPDLDTPEALRAFDFYRTRSIALLGGVAGGPGIMATRSPGFIEAAELWGGPVIQLAVSEPAVRHALLALSSLHERVSMPRSARAHGTTTAFAYAEYGKAITAVRSWGNATATTEPAVVPLVVCVLFICIEFLAGYEDAALVHIRQGRTILSKLDPEDRSPAMELVRSVLAPMYARLSLASFTFGTRPERIPQGFLQSRRPGASGGGGGGGGAESAGTAGGGNDPRRGVGPGGGYPSHMEWEVPLVFDSLKSARDSIFWLVDEGLRFSTTGKPAVFNLVTDPEEMRALGEWQRWLLGQLRRWDAAFTLLKTTLPMDRGHGSLTGAANGLGARTARALQDLLLMYYHTSVVWVSTALTPHESAYDDYIGAFSAIVSHASSVIAAISAEESHSSSSDGGGGGGGGKESVNFTFECEIVPPVYWAATRCRHPLLRRAALQLLGRPEVKHRREGLWRADVSYAVARKVIEVEEEGIAAIYQHELDAGTYVIETTPPPYVSVMAPPTLKRQPTAWEDGPPLGQVDAERFTVDDTLLLLPRYNASASSNSGSSSGERPPSGDEGAPGNGLHVDGGDATVALLLSGHQSIDPTLLESPYGVPEHRRIKNTVMTQHRADGGGIWVTIFLSPQPGETAWDTRQMWVRV